MNIGTPLAITALMLTLSAAHAAETQFNFTGIVTAATSIPELPAPGATFTGSFSFDPSLLANSVSTVNSATFADFDSGVLIHQNQVAIAGQNVLVVHVAGLVTTDGTSFTIDGYTGDVNGNNIDLDMAAHMNGPDALTLPTSFDTSIMPFNGQFVVSSVNGSSPWTIPFSITSISAVPEPSNAMLMGVGAAMGGLLVRRRKSAN